MHSGKHQRFVWALTLWPFNETMLANTQHFFCVWWFFLCFDRCLFLSFCILHTVFGINVIFFFFFVQGNRSCRLNSLHSQQIAIIKIITIIIWMDLVAAHSLVCVFFFLSFFFNRKLSFTFFFSPALGSCKWIGT